MTFEIALVFIILLVALVLFITAWIRMDVVAILVLGALSLTGLVSTTEALSGFSNPAVITVWSMFILSAGLYRTGIARMISRQLLHLTGSSELKMITVIMLTSGLMSGFINNIGVATLMLPVVMDLARSTGMAPGRLLIPLAFGCHLGGFTTLIGTPPNLLISYALENEGHRPLQLFDFTPVGLGAMIAGIAFMAFIGRHLLPKQEKSKSKGADNGRQNIPGSYSLQERAFFITIQPGSHLAGQTLAQSRLRAALGINVLSVFRQDKVMLAPSPDTIINTHDKLHVLGRLDSMGELMKWNIKLPENEDLPVIKSILKRELDIYESLLTEKSPLIGKCLLEKDFSGRLNINLLAIKQANGRVLRSRLREYRFKPQDILLLQGEPGQIDILEKEGSIATPSKPDYKYLTENYHLHETLFIMEVGDEAQSFTKEKAEIETGSTLGITLMAVLDNNNHPRLLQPYEELGPGDRLLIKCNSKDLSMLHGLRHLDMSEEGLPATQSLESDEVQLAEVVLAPRSSLEGKTLREVNFRKKYGLTVLAIWREGKVHRTNLHNIPLRFGEALLLYGKRETFELISSDNDFIVLTESKQPPIRTQKALVSLLIMLGVLLPVVFGLIPLAISSIIGVAAMVLTGCLKMEEAYKSVEWRSVFLIAGMLPLGIAMHQTGAATYLAGIVINWFGILGPWGVIMGLYLITTLTTFAIPPPALVVLMSPVALQAAESFQISPHTVMIAIAVAASSTFLSPVSHAANLLVMGPGGYKFTDYTRVGAPLSLVIFLTVMLLLPLFWPL